MVIKSEIVPQSLELPLAQTCRTLGTLPCISMSAKAIPQKCCLGLDHAHPDGLLSLLKSKAGKLAALVGIENLWHPLRESTFQNIQTKVDIQGIGDFS